MGAQEGIW